MEPEPKPQVLQVQEPPPVEVSQPDHIVESFSTSSNLEAPNASSIVESDEIQQKQPNLDQQTSSNDDSRDASIAATVASSEVHSEESKPAADIAESSDVDSSNNLNNSDNMTTNEKSEESAPVIDEIAPAIDTQTLIEQTEKEPIEATPTSTTLTEASADLITNNTIIPIPTVPTSTTVVPPPQTTPQLPHMPPHLGPGIHPPMYGMHMHPTMHPDMMHGYPPHPMLHGQERAAIQQQLQEMYCLPMADNQDKVMRLQERLNLLQQHETTEQCAGGPQCPISNPMFSAPMIDSPQVSSTTGRGRGRAPSNKPRKPRMKKAEKLAQAAAQAAAVQGLQPVVTSGDETSQTNITPSALPVSEDSVTAGTGEAISDSFTDMGMEAGDLSQDNLESGDLDTSTDPSGKKIKKPRKPRVPKVPKEPKEPKEGKEPKEPKERKKREPKDPDKPKKKRGRKPNAEGDNSISMDNNSQTVNSEGDENQTLASMLHTQNSNDAQTAETIKIDEEATDYDDIPVSKIPIKGSMDDLSKDNDDHGDTEDHDEGDGTGDTPKKRKYRRGEPGSGDKKRRSAAAGRGRGRTSSAKGSRGRRGRMITDDDEDGDDLVTTPPPSPPEIDIDSSKRRSARNTQRKKYVDDVMIRFSDDESGMISPTPSVKKEKKELDKKELEFGVDGSEPNTVPNTDDDNTKVSTTESIEKVKDDVEKPVDEAKPNYVYINTGDEDSMVSFKIFFFLFFEIRQ